MFFYSSSRRSTPVASLLRPATSKGPKLEKPPFVAVTHPVEEDEEEEEEEDLEDETMKSAVALLSGFAADEDGGGYGLDAADYDY